MSNSKKLQDDIAKHRGFSTQSNASYDDFHEIMEKVGKELNEALRQMFTTAPKCSIGIPADGRELKQEDYPELYRVIKLERNSGCSHSSKRKEGITTLFWVCNQCGKDLGNV